MMLGLLGALVEIDEVDALLQVLGLFVTYANEDISGRAVKAIANGEKR